MRDFIPSRTHVPYLNVGATVPVTPVVGHTALYTLNKNLVQKDSDGAVRSFAPVLDAGAYGTIGTQAAIVAAIAAIGSDSRTLNLSPATWSITADLTIPANITLKVERGATLAIATTKTLAITGDFEAGLYQVFSCTGTGKVVLTKINNVYTVWWGDATDNTTISAAFLAAPAGSTVHFEQNKTYTITDPGVSIAKSLNVEGHGATLVSAITAGNALLAAAGFVKETISSGIENFYSNQAYFDVPNTTTAIKGDLLHCRSTDMYNNERANYILGGNAVVTGIEISSVGGKTRLYISRPFPFDMTGANLTIRVCTPVTVNVWDLILQGPTPVLAITYGMSLGYTVYSTLTNIKAEGFAYCFHPSASVGVTLTNCVAGRSYYVGSSDSYGVGIDGCTDTTLNNMVSHSGRHGVAHCGYEVNFGTIINGGSIGSEVEACVAGGGVYYGLDAHGNTYDITLNSVTLPNGFSVAGNAVFNHCNIGPGYGGYMNYIYPAEAYDRASYIFNQCNFRGDTDFKIWVNTYSTNLSPNQKYIKSIKFNDCSMAGKNNCRLSIVLNNNGYASLSGEPGYAAKTVLIDNFTILNQNGPVVIIRDGTEVTPNLTVGLAAIALEVYDTELIRDAADEVDGFSISNRWPGGYGNSLKFFSRRSDQIALTESGRIASVGAASWANAGGTGSHLDFSTVQANTLIHKMRLSSFIYLYGLPTYADNTAAAALPTDAVYKTAAGQLMIKY